MSEFDLDELKSIFVEEAHEIFDEIDRVLLAAEKKGFLEPDAINSLFRAVHTIKGNSGSMELMRLMAFSHEVETFLGRLRANEIEFDKEMISLLIGCGDIMRVISDMESSGALSDEDADGLTRKLCLRLNQASSCVRDPQSEAVSIRQTPKDEDTAQVDQVDKKESRTQGARNTIRVDLGKIDTLMNNVGELVIASSMIYQFGEMLEGQKLKADFMEKIALLDRHIKELQDAVMSVRMVPMEQVYNKFPKMIRDTASKLGKEVEFSHFGSDVEIDKAMIEGLTDPLVHILRNSLDHGLESTNERVGLGKPSIGKITMDAQQANGQIIIKVSDDGGGIDIEKVAKKAVEKGLITLEQSLTMSESEKCEIIFLPGFSTASSISDISGRGVGMDVVKTNINKLGGVIKVVTKKSQGTTISIVLPLTLAILDGLNVSVGEMHYIVPVVSIAESLQPDEEMVKKIGGGELELLMLRGEFIPIVRLHRLFDIKPRFEEIWEGMLIVVKSGAQTVALFVDEFLHQQQVVVKPLDKNFRQVEGIGAATVRGNGTIGLILDVMGIIEKQKEFERRFRV